MIVVNVTEKKHKKVYNMNLEEKALIGDVIAEIAGLVGQKEHLNYDGDLREMVLGSKDLGLVFSRDRTLADYGILTGAELIIV